MSTDFSGMIAFAQSLAETVKQAQTATEELAVARTALAEATSAIDTLRGSRDEWRNDYHTATNTITSLRTELAASEARNAEVSEALARANAKLDSFRQLLGVDSGTGAPVPTPAVLPEQPTHAVAEPPHEAQPVDPAPAPGTGGVAPNDPPQVNKTAYDFVTAEPASTRHMVPEPHSPDPSGGTAETHAAPAPEVAEPRPTPPQTGGSHEPSSGPMDDRFGQAQEARPFDTTTGSTPSASSEGGPLSWRDSASHVPYRAFSY